MLPQAVDELGGPLRIAVCPGHDLSPSPFVVQLFDYGKAHGNVEGAVQQKRTLIGLFPGQHFRHNASAMSRKESMNIGRGLQYRKMDGAEYNIRQSLILMAHNLESGCHTRVRWRVIGCVDKSRPCNFRLSRQNRDDPVTRFGCIRQIFRPLLFVDKRFSWSHVHP